MIRKKLGTIAEEEADRFAGSRRRGSSKQMTDGRTPRNISGS